MYAIRDTALPGVSGCSTELCLAPKACRASPVLQSQGSKTKPGRWYDIWDKSMGIQQWNSTLLLVIIYIGLHTKFYKDLSDTPLAGRLALLDDDELGDSGVRGEGPLLVVPRDGAPEDLSRNVRDSDREVERLRRSCRNTLQVAALIYSNRVLKGLWLLVGTIVEVFKHEHNKTVQQLKTQKGAMSWHIRMALGGWEEYLIKSSFVFGDLRLLVESGLHRAHPSTPVSMLFDKETCIRVCSKAFEYWRLQVAYELRWVRMYSDSLPGKFFALQLDAREHQAEVLMQIEEWWNAILLVEEQMEGDIWLKNFHRDLLFPSSTWVREVLTGLAECEWADVPSDIAKELEGMARGMGTTDPIENLFNWLREKMRKDKGGKLKPLGQWHRAVSSPLLKEIDRPGVPFSPAAQSSRIELSQDMFIAKNCKFSMGDDKIDRFLEGQKGRAAWPHPSSSNLLLVPMALAALCQNVGEWARLRMSWLSLLAVPGTLASNRANPGEAGIVLDSTAYGIVLWRSRPIKWGGLRGCMLEPRAGKSWTQVCIGSVADLEHWKCLPVQAAPGHVISELSGVPCSQGISCFVPPDTEAKPLLQVSAEHAFLGLTVPYMDMLVDALGVQWRTPSRPTLERDLCNLLVRFVLPDLSDAEVDAILEKRKMKKPLEFQTILTEEVADEVQHLLDEDDQSDAQGLAKEVRAAAKIAIARKAMAPEVGLRPVRLTSLSLAEARAFLPKVKFCTLALHKNSGWLVKYPCRQPPMSHTSAWALDGGDSAALGALKEALRWVWAEHTAQTEEACPWELDG